LDHALVARLRPLAARRDLPIRGFIREVLDAVGEEPSLAAAILDD
jgi:hypothetical protein